MNDLMTQLLIFLSIESRVFTFEEGLWNIRGCYEKACEEDEDLVWSNIDGEHVTHILIVSLSSSSFLQLIHFWTLELFWRRVHSCSCCRS